MSHPSARNPDPCQIPGGPRSSLTKALFCCSSLSANLDRELQNFLVKWFPHEVKEKERSNNKEAAKEELEEMGIPDRKCLIM